MNTLTKASSRSASIRGRRLPKYMAVCASLQSSIRSGEYGVGDRLPSQDELSTRHGVSLLTVRQAVGVLEASGVLTREQGRGTFVRRKDAGLSGGSTKPPRPVGGGVALVMVGGDLNSSYHRTEISAFERMLGERDRPLLISTLAADDIARNRLPAALRTGSVQGVLCENFVQDSHVQFLRHHGFPVVVMGVCPLTVPVANVVHNHSQAAYLLSRAIGGLGKGPLYFLTEPFKYYYTHEVYDGYSRACREMNKPECLRTVRDEKQDPYFELRQVIEENDGPFSLIVHANIAHALRDLIKEAGLNQDEHPVAIYGAADYVTPEDIVKFNRTGPDVQVLGEVAISVLDRVISGENVGKVVIEPELLIATEPGIQRFNLRWRAPNQVAESDSISP